VLVIGRNANCPFALSLIAPALGVLLCLPGLIFAQVRSPVNRGSLYASVKEPCMLQGVRFSTYADHTDTVLELDAAVLWKSGYLLTPPRLYVDLPCAQVSPEYETQSRAFQDATVRQMRLGKSITGIRVVFDLRNPASYKILPQANPSRVVIRFAAAARPSRMPSQAEAPPIISLSPNQLASGPAVKQIDLEIAGVPSTRSPIGILSPPTDAHPPSELRETTASSGKVGLNRDDAFSPSVAIQHSATSKAAREFKIHGVVLDPAGAVVPGAVLTLNDSPQESRTSSVGEFEYRDLKPGQYLVRAHRKEFSPAERLVELDAIHPQAFVRMMLTISPVVTTVSSTDDNPGSGLDPAHGSGTFSLNPRQLEALPDDPDAFQDQLKVLAATAGGVPGSAVVTVDGTLNAGRLPPKSAIAEVRVNPDLYAAEYGQPPYEGGRIEIRSKPAESFHGSASLFWNDSSLNARNAFAPTRPPAESKRYGFDLGGPIRRHKASFFTSLEKRDNDLFAVIDAITLDNQRAPTPYKANLPAPQELWIGTSRVDWRANAANIIAVAFDANHETVKNAGAGGFVLPESAYGTLTRDYRGRLTETATINSHVFLDTRLAVTLNRVQQTPVSSDPAIVVPGAFQAGGAVGGALNERIESLDYASTAVFSAGTHAFKTGLEIFYFKTHENTRENFAGMLTFAGQPLLSGQYLSGLDQYRAVLLGFRGVFPTTYTITSGNPNLNNTQWQGNAFVQDDWKLSQSFSLSYGMRYEMQTGPMDRGSWAPRFGVAYALDSKRRWVLRARTGLFYTRVSNTTSLEVRRLSASQERQLIVYAPAVSDPLTGIASVTTFRQFEDGIRPPRSWQSQLALEHDIGRGWIANTNISWTTASRMLRTRNINAPLLAANTADPLEAPRPLGIPINLMQLESSARFTGPAFFVGLNQTRHKYFNLFVGYLYQDFHTNADSPFFQSQSSYSDQGEWTSPSWQTKHRGFAVGTLNLPWKASANFLLNVASGTPLNVISGPDNNGDGSFNDRPSVVQGGSGAVLTPFGALNPNAVNGTLPRNIGLNPANATLDCQLTRNFIIHRSPPDRSQSVTVSIRASNLLNRTNFSSLNGVLLSPFFLQPNSSGPARRIEVSTRFLF
jgi:hypothetical protein